MATEDWIQESLARLESLEDERNKHEAALETASDPNTLRMHTQAIERLETKIRALYAELESVADQGGGATDEDEDEDDGDSDRDDDGGSGSVNDSPEVETRLFRREDVAAQAAALGAPNPTIPAAKIAAQPAPASPFGGAAQPAPFGGAAQPAPFGQPAPVQAAPFGQPAPVQAAPFGGAPVQAAPFGSSPSSFDADGDDLPSSGFSSSTPSSFSGGGGSSFDDDSSSGGGAKWGIIIAVVLVVGGIGGYLAFGGKKEVPPPAEPTGPTKVLKAGEVPPDTQGPKSIKGGNADSTQGSNIKEGRPGSGGGGGGGGGSSSSSSDKPKKKDPKTSIHQTDDPLAGINDK
jgi:hypothetical protein